MEDKQKEHDRINLEYRISIMILDFFERNGYTANYIEIDKGTYTTHFNGLQSLYNCRFIIKDMDYQHIAIGTDDIDGIVSRHENRHNN